MAVGYVLLQIIKLRFRNFLKAIPSISRRLKMLAFFIIEPVAIVSTFWALDMPERGVLVLPLLGAAIVFTGMVAALAAVRILKEPPYRAGSLFTCCTFSNVLTIGGLIAFTFLGEPGYGIVQLVAIPIGPIYIMMGYPISANVGRGRKPVFKISLVNLKENPFLILPIAAIICGIGLHATNLTRPPVFVDIVSVIVPGVSALLGLSIGLTLRFTGFRSYLKELIAVLVVRHVVIPAVIVPLAILMGLGGISGGLPLKVAVILSCVPVAFSALVPPAIYGFDLDLANSAWMVSTLFLAVVVPVLLLVFRVVF
jgi:predicted permease